jgi:tetratricopeptide (TPR) repeat protein
MGIGFSGIKFGIRLAVATAISALWACSANAGEADCGALSNHFGPYDYRTDRAQLPVVENYHFRPEVEALMRSKEDISGQLNYVLRAFPNHHRALLTLVRYSRVEKSAQPKRLAYSVSCFFDRAIRFRPDDTTVRMIFAQYLASIGKKDAAIEQLNQAVTFARANAWTHYNIGLVYFELGSYEQAQAQAQRAMELGFDRGDLTDMLRSKGYAISAQAAASAASAAVPANTASAPTPAGDTDTAKPSSSNRSR